MPQVLSNRTIDDQFGDSVTGALPSYSPLSTWNQGANCGGCTLHPDPAPAFNHTWHDNSQPPGDAQAVSVSFDFTGTAVWVFCIVPPVMQNDTITHYILSFDLDNGTHRGNFTHFPTGNEYLYNVPVVSLPSLSNTAHTLSISTDGAVDGSAFLFDYAVYTWVGGGRGRRACADEHWDNCGHRLRHARFNHSSSSGSAAIHGLPETAAEPQVTSHSASRGTVQG
ncbi:hypothetical protein B0H19DRAFT_242101 [Mycena capillaripes]|nr:hypothetical protein B0H19DRAFT_242101 [Mycena capillaripes]